MTPITSLPGTPFYAGMIDGATVLSIYPDPTSFAFLFASPGQTVNIPALNPGLPGPTLLGGPALETIGIEHEFALSRGRLALSVRWCDNEHLRGGCSRVAGTPQVPESPA